MGCNKPSWKKCRKEKKANGAMSQQAPMDSMDTGMMVIGRSYSVEIQKAILFRSPPPPPPPPYLTANNADFKGSRLERKNQAV
jgi:hypothetical protein